MSLALLKKGDYRVSGFKGFRVYGLESSQGPLVLRDPLQDSGCTSGVCGDPASQRGLKG